MKRLLEAGQHLQNIACTLWCPFQDVIFQRLCPQEDLWTLMLSVLEACVEEVDEELDGALFFLQSYGIVLSFSADLNENIAVLLICLLQCWSISHPILTKLVFMDFTRCLSVKCCGRVVYNLFFPSHLCFYKCSREARSINNKDTLLGMLHHRKSSLLFQFTNWWLCPTQAL